MDQTDVADAYRLYATAIWRRCRLILRDEATARDVTQEVFARCFRHHPKLRPGRELLGWLYRVATNLCLNELRDQKTRRDAAPDADDRAGAGEGEGEGEAVTRLMTWQALQGLDRRSQEIAVYVFVDGMTHAEAAGVSERTVRYCLSHVVDHGRQRLGVRLPQEET